MFATVAVLTIALDVVTKVAAVEFLADRDPVEVVPGVLDLTLVRNPGAAFGLGTGQTWLLSAIAIIVVGVVLRMAGRLRDRGWALALGLLLGGAVGNLLDRLFRQPGPMRGHVIDFLQLPNWPVFNLADSAICLAAALVVWRSLRGVELDGRTE
jgi:signal peptidase II